MSARSTTTTSASLGQLLQQRPDRRDADAGADQQHAVVLAGVGGERAVGALDRHPRARPQPRRARALWSPSSLTVIRSAPATGAAESEYGCACHQSPRRRKRHCRNWPPATGRRCRRRPRSDDRVRVRALRRARPRRVTRWRSERHTGSATRQATTSASVPIHSAVHHVLAHGWPTNDAPGVDLVREGQEQRQVGVEVHRPPGLVGHPPARPAGRR